MSSQASQAVSQYIYLCRPSDYLKNARALLDFKTQAALDLFDRLKRASSSATYVMFCFQKQQAYIQDFASYSSAISSLQPLSFC